MDTLVAAFVVLSLGGACLIIASLLSDPEEEQEEGEWPLADGSWPE